jgi:hypothetical protein
VHDTDIGVGRINGRRNNKQKRPFLLRGTAYQIAGNGYIWVRQRLTIGCKLDSSLPPCAEGVAAVIMFHAPLMARRYQNTPSSRGALARTGGGAFRQN